MDNTTSDTSTLLGLVADVGDVVGASLDIALAHPIISFFLGCSVVAAGYGLFTIFRKKSR